MLFQVRSWRSLVRRLPQLATSRTQEKFDEHDSKHPTSRNWRAERGRGSLVAAVTACWTEALAASVEASADRCAAFLIL